MKVYHSLEEYESSLAAAGSARRGCSAALGKFDGVHIGHTKLIRDVIHKAHEHELYSVVFAIEMKEGTILSHQEREAYLDSLGVDLLIECPFSKEFMSMSPESFARHVLAGILHAEYVTVGTDYAFGYQRRGDAALLASLGERYGFRTTILEKEKLLGKDVSSSRIRMALKEGDMELSGALLGRPYPILGTVVHGRHIGTGIGVPTANVVPEAGKILPPDGVYASVTHLKDGSRRYSMTNLGVRPTVGGTTRRAETMLFDYHHNLYGERIQVDLVSFIRPEKKFSTLEDLKEQIMRDRDRIKSSFDEISLQVTP